MRLNGGVSSQVANYNSPTWKTAQVDSMNVPASAYSSQNGIVAQVYSNPPDDTDVGDAANHVVPPHSLVFLTNNPGKRRGSKRSRFTNDTEANYHPSYSGHSNARTNNVTDMTFLGVSSEGLPDGAAAVKFPSAATHYTVVTRGLVTVMACYRDVKDIPLRSYVRLKAHDASTDMKFSNFPGKYPMSLEACHREDAAAIGVLIRKPSTRAAMNECDVLLV